MDLIDTLLGLLCRLGFHNFRVIEVTYGFGDAGDPESAGAHINPAASAAQVHRNANQCHAAGSLK